LHWWLADQQAAVIEPGSKALLLDHDGYVTETSTSCFFLVRNGRIVTSNRGVLNSLSGQIVEEVADSLNIPFERRAICESELETADEAFLSSTPVGILPVSHLNGRRLSPFHDTSVTGLITDAWSQLVGLDIVGQVLNF
jgi:branched-chain amino acid aminotransferase